jgi:hypothetical protein
MEENSHRADVSPHRGEVPLRARPHSAAMSRHHTLLTTATLLAVLTTAGCGDGDTQPTAPPVCDSLAAAQATVDHIRDTNESENGLTQLRPYLEQLRTELTQLYTDAKTEFASV